MLTHHRWTSFSFSFLTLSESIISLPPIAITDSDDVGCGVGRFKRHPGAGSIHRTYTAGMATRCFSGSNQRAGCRFGVMTRRWRVDKFISAFSFPKKVLHLKHALSFVDGYMQLDSWLRFSRVWNHFQSKYFTFTPYLTLPSTTIMWSSDGRWSASRHVTTSTTATPYHTPQVSPLT